MTQHRRTDSSGHSKTAYSATERTDMGKLGTAVNMAVASSVPSITIMKQGKCISIQRSLNSLGERNVIAQE
ncbi:hypothetical protein Ddc_18381 [Ditylenchus destructor]|nr:hypothetical protein Ddc_18381 [Ditylenchus destructor]